MTATFPRDPDSVLDYEVSWAAWLETGETITASEWIVPLGITKNSDSHDDTTATIWLSGGTDGVAYECTNRITTSAGRTDDRSIRIDVYNR